MPIAIRAARPEDEPRLHAIHADATMSSYGREHPWLEPILRDPATRLEPVEWTIVAHDTDVEDEDTAVLGYAAVTDAHLENLYIDPAAQGRGVGTALLAEVEARVAAQFDAMTLRCLHANPDARRLYERNGFRVRETQTIDLHGTRLASWLMVKPLR